MADLRPIKGKETGSVSLLEGLQGLCGLCLMGGRFSDGLDGSIDFEATMVISGFDKLCFSNC